MADIWQHITRELDGRRPLVVATVVRDSGSVPRRSGSKMLVRADGTTVGTVGGGTFEVLVVRDALHALRDRASFTKAYSFNPKGSADDAFGAVCGGRVEVFLEVVMPPDRLLVVGGGHCGLALVQAAALLGDFSIVVADDREDYARPDRFPFPGVQQVIRCSADFRELPEPDERTYVALVSKGFITDEAALRRVIASPAAYLGMMGSVKKRDVVFAKLRADGVGDDLLARVRCPIGLEIGAHTPQEIAVSILAEIVQLRAARQAPREHTTTTTAGEVTDVVTTH